MYDQGLLVKEHATLAKVVGLEAWDFGKIVATRTGQKTNPNVSIGGEDIEGFATNNWDIGDGRLFTQDELNSNKNVAILGGGKGMPGAVVLAAKAALRSGIGLVRTLVAPENVAAVLAAVPSALSSEWPGTAHQIKAEISNWANAIVLGPGLGKSSDTRKLVESVLRDSKIPVLLDADALNVFERDAQSLGKMLGGRAALITPHVAEFARLTGIDVREVIANRFDVGVQVARELGATVLLKGSPTVVFSPSGERYVIARGSAALGTGGSGDLLSGIAGTLLAQLEDASAAACCAAWVHGRAAELCAYIRGTTLEDVLYALPRAWNEPEPSPEPPVLTVLPAVAR